MIPQVLSFFEQNKDAIQSIAAALSAFISLLALGAISLTWWQLREVRQQRDIAESLDLYDRLTAGFSAWQNTANGAAGAVPLNNAVGSLVGLYEIIAGALNSKSLPRNTRSLLRNHARDGIGLICEHKKSSQAIISIAQDKCVYRSLRKFLLTNRSFVTKGKRFHGVYSTFFSDHKIALILDRGFHGFLIRRAIRIHIAILKRSP